MQSAVGNLHSPTVIERFKRIGASALVITLLTFGLDIKFTDEQVARIKAKERPNNKSAIELLEDTDCVIEILPKEFSNWKY